MILRFADKNQCAQADILRDVNDSQNFVSIGICALWQIFEKWTRA